MHKKKVKFCMQKFILEKFWLRTKFDLRLEKPKKVLGTNFHNHKKMPVIKFPYMELYDKHFFKKSKPRFLSPDCFY